MTKIQERRRVETSNSQPLTPAPTTDEPRSNLHRARGAREKWWTAR